MDLATAQDVVNKLDAIKEAKKQGLNVEYVIRVLTDYVYEFQRTGEHLNEIAKSLLANPPEGEEGHSRIKLTPDTLLTSDYLIDRIKHWVELVRTEIFGSSQVPFNSITEAAAWLVEQEEAEPLPGEQPQRPGGQRVPVTRFINGKEEPWQAGKIPLMYPIHIRIMPCLGFDGKENNVRLTSTKPFDWYTPEQRPKFNGRLVGFTPLSWLDNETKIMERFTGFTQLSLVQYTLTGSKPIMQRFTTKATRTSFNLPNGEKLQPTKVEVKILANDLTFKELQEIYTHSRTYLKIQRGKMLNEKHHLLYLMVKSKGGPPKGKGVVAFWKSVKSEWNSLYPDDSYQSWKGVKQNYERVIEKLKERFESNVPGRIIENETP